MNEIRNLKIVETKDIELYLAGNNSKAYIIIWPMFLNQRLIKSNQNYIRFTKEKIKLLKQITQITSMDHGNRLNCNQELFPEDYLSSETGYFAVMQKDGNFVIYVTQVWAMWNSLWTTKTMFKTLPILPRRIVMQQDGNLVIYDSCDKPQWCSYSKQKNKGNYYLLLGKQGNLEIFNEQDKVIWTSANNL